MAQQTYGEYMRSNPPIPNLTAVEWLVHQEISVDLGSGIKMKIPIPENVIEQAKQMEKEQIMKAIDRGFDEGCKFPEDISLKNAEQYYNETYKP